MTNLSSNPPRNPIVVNSLEHLKLKWIDDYIPTDPDGTLTSEEGAVDQFHQDCGSQNYKGAQIKPILSSPEVAVDVFDNGGSSTCGDATAEPQTIRQTLLPHQIGGNGGGNPFQSYPRDSTTVKSIDVYCGLGDGTPYIVRGIQLTWFNDQKSPLFGQTTSDHSTYTFDQHERIQSMVINAGWRIDRIQFTTNKGTFTAGGEGGKRYEVDIGNGLMVGMEGRCGWDIDSLGMTFQAL